MSLFAEFVAETTDTGGTTAMQLGGAGAGYQTFVAGVGDGGKCLYVCRGRTGTADAGKFECGLGMVTAGTPDALSRETVYESSAGYGTKESFTAGVTSDVFIVPAAVVLNLLLTSFASDTGRPDLVRQYGLWLDTSATPWVYRFYDGAHDCPVFSVDPAGGAVVPYLGAAGLGTAAGLDAGDVCQTANNLSDVADAATARDNLGGNAAGARTVQAGGTPAGGSDGDIVYIY